MGMHFTRNSWCSTVDYGPLAPNALSVGTNRLRLETEGHVASGSFDTSGGDVNVVVLRLFGVLMREH